MNAKFLKSLPLLLGLAVGMTGCIDRTQTADPTSSATQEGGKVSFRLSSADLLKIGVGVDSVRIEAVREGYPLQVAMGSLTQDVVLANLASGGWTLRVALFDRTQAIHYYGEAYVNILPGRTVDAEVRLSKATGSVRVRIVLDPDPNVRLLDTLTVQNGSQSPSWTPLKAWRTQAGVYMISTLLAPCEWPVLTFEENPMVLIVRAAGGAPLVTPMPVVDRSRWVLGKGIDTGRACVELYQEHTHFVPWIASGPITLVTSTGEIFLPDTFERPNLDTARFTAIPTTGTKPTFLPILSAFRNDTGVHILTQYYCQSPVVRDLPDSGIRWVFGNNPDIAMDCMVGAPKPVWVFVPQSRCGTIQLEDANGKVLYLPGKACVDPNPVTLDTVLVKAEDGIMLSRSFGEKDGLPVEKVWRDASSIWVYTRFDCNIQPRALYNIYMVPGVVADPNGDSLVVAKRPAPSGIPMTLIRPQNPTEIGCAERPHVVRIPFGPEKDVMFGNLLNGAGFFLPGNSTPVVRDSSFQQYSSTNSGGFGGGFDYILYSNGTVHRTPSHGMITVDTLVVPAKADIPPDSLAMIANLLESSRIRHPEGACVVAEPAITYPTVDTLKIDPAMVAPPVSTTQTRLVNYANGTVSAQKWNTSLNCVPPKSWSALDVVDRMLASLFPAR
ncbi:MAG: hypothetical protein IPK50_16835 [Fibrobacterota bacterium]|nr:hypothetical protein [Fibrobacterota bacterium]QQS03947.1 MAG: hypothetical protein IPK50_16835 [Fibrobacterota bacterium]